MTSRADGVMVRGRRSGAPARTFLSLSRLGTEGVPMESRGDRRMPTGPESVRRPMPGTRTARALR